MVLCYAKALAVTRQGTGTCRQRGGDYSLRLLETFMKLQPSCTRKVKPFWRKPWEIRMKLGVEKKYRGNHSIRYFMIITCSFSVFPWEGFEIFQFSILQSLLCSNTSLKQAHWRINTDMKKQSCCLIE